MTDPAALAELLRPALMRMGRRMRRQALGQDLSSNDAVLLGHIRRNPGLGVSGLAELEGTSQPTISSQIKRLERLGFVARLVDPEDARRAGLVVTPAGQRRFEAIHRQRTDWLARRLAILPAEDRARLAEAAPALARLADTP